MDVAGKISIGNDEVEGTAGTVRWTGHNFEGFTGTVWRTLDVQSVSGGGWTDDGTVVRLITGTDNVGIGTTTPARRLHVLGHDGDGYSIEASHGVLLATLGGNVGIGTTSPGARLHVEGTIEVDQKIQANDPGGLELATDEGITRLFIRDDGNVGIGTMGPRAKLSVAGGGAFGSGYAGTSVADGNMIISGNVGIGTTNPGAKLEVVGQIKITGGTPVFGEILTTDASGLASWQEPAGGGLPSGGTGQTLRHDGTRWIANSLLFNDGANIGIGTTAPGEKLDIENAEIQFSGGYGLDWEDNPWGGVGDDAWIRYIQDGSHENTELQIGVAGDWEDNIAFWQHGAERMTIQRGNVGIGTTVPGTRLHVRGATSDATAHGLRIDNSVGTGLMVVRNDGNVGIGTTAPVSKLGVLGNLAVGGTYALAAAPAGGIIIEGRAGIGTTTPGTQLSVAGGSAFGSGYALTSVADGNIVISGNVGIGMTTPDRPLQVVQGSTRDPIADDWTIYSSRRWKENIHPIQGALDKVMKMTGVSFNWKENGKHDIGMIAEEVGKIIPEVVEYEENGKDATSLGYTRLVAVLIEAIKEQQEQIEDLEQDVTRLKRKLIE